MRGHDLRSCLLTAVGAFCFLAHAYGGDLKITLPKHSKFTPVQQFNREGVEQIKKHHVDRAKRLFYKAYLLDPNDPFTLNNLGYISELEGDAERALRYYQLSSENTSEAKIDIASRVELKGKPLQNAFQSLQVPELKANRRNIEAISLMGKGRVSEAGEILKKGLTEDPHNPFTLNNLGYVMEAEGDLQGAVRYYSAAASTRAQDVILVAPNAKWRGKAISEVAAQNARAVNQVIAKGEDSEARVARLNLRGVAALNHNDRQSAREFFQQAYRLDPNNSFSLNNMGYVAELDGDRETAETYYEQARRAADSNLKVTYATRRDAEGLPMGQVAQDNQTDVDARIEALRAIRQREGGPIVLKHRDNTPVVEPEKAPPLPQSATPPPLPAPEPPERSEQPPSLEQREKAQPPQLLQPLPESEQPPAAQTPGQQPPQQMEQRPPQN